MTFFAVTYPRSFIEVRGHLQPCSLCEYSVPLSTGFKVAVAEKIHKAAGFLMLDSGYLGNESLNVSHVSALCIRVECARTNTQKLVSHYFLFYFKFNAYFLLD